MLVFFWLEETIRWIRPKSHKTLVEQFLYSWFYDFFFLHSYRSAVARVWIQP